MSLPDTERTAGEKKFIHEQTRTLLIKWCHHQILFGSMPTTNGTAKDRAIEAVYVAHAISKKWVSKDGTKVLSAGFTSAAGRLKN
jgi:hypothetical protein|tara:strand:+ start:318 stop:572 length:255 start_codon:yes stop_codon:yes gene_type:complete